MSQRVYTGPRSDRRRHRSPLLLALPWVLALGVIGLDIAYPLVHGTARRDVVVVTVVVFFLASVSHAVVWRGALWTLGFLVVTVGGGLAVEVLGLRTGLPFGDYAYSGSLTRTVLGVPWVVPLAWAMVAYPVLVAARRLARSAVVVALVGGWALASWDLFLDPMMTGEGYWSFTDTSHALPHVPGVPAVNYLGWLVTGVVMMALLDRLPRRHVPEGQPALLFLWTYVSSVVAHVFFLDQPWVALYGGVAMGLVAVPYAWVLWVGRE
jgi:putative membrane protein